MNDELLQRIYDYLDGELDARAHAEFEKRLESDSALAEAVEEARTFERALHANFPRNEFPSIAPTVQVPQSRWRMAPIAAAAGIILCGGMAWAAVETGLWNTITTALSGAATTHEEVESVVEADNRLAREVVEELETERTDVQQNAGDDAVDTAKASTDEVAAIITRVEGRVVALDGGPIARAKVTAVKRGESLHDAKNPIVATTGSDGAFAMALPPHRRLVIEADGYSSFYGNDIPPLDGIESEFTLTPLQTVGGQVLDLEGNPIVGATVYGELTNRPARTNSEGRFSIATARNHVNNYRGLAIIHPEYAPHWAHINSTDMKIWMMEGGTVEFTVLEGAMPVEGAQVTIHSPDLGPDLPTQFENITDAEGKVTLGPFNVSDDLSFRVTLPDGTVRSTSDEPFDIMRGEVAQATVTFPYPRPHTISGVVAIDDEPVAYTGVSVYANDTGIRMRIETDSNGAYSFQVADGTYTVQAGKLSDDGRRFSGWAEVVTAGGSSAHTADIALVARREDRFEIVDRDGEPVDVFRDANGSRMVMADATPVRGIKQGRLYLSEDQRWAGYAILKSAEDPTYAIELVHPVSEAVTGRIVDEGGLPVPGAVVSGRLYGERFAVEVEGFDRDFGLYHAVTTMTDEDGRYRLGPLLTEGSYIVEAGHLEYTRIKDAEGHWEFPTITPSDDVALSDIVLVRNTTFIEGIVEYDTGRLLPNSAHLQLDHERYVSKGFDSPHGRFRFSVPEGEYTLMVSLNPTERSAPMQVGTPSDMIPIVFADPQTYMSVTEANAMDDLDEATNNFKQMGLVVKMYAGEHKDKFPPLGREYGIFCPDLDEIYPDYLTNLRVAASMLGEEPVRAVYTGYTLTTELDGLAFLDAYATYGPEAIYGEDIKVEKGYGTGGGATIFQLRDGIERLLITDINDPAAAGMAQSTIPIAWELPTTRAGKGGLVLFLDGHVEWMSYPSTFPMTEAFMENLTRIIVEADEAAGR